MEARIHKAALLAVVRRTALLAVLLLVSMGTQQRSANFVVETADPQFAVQVAQAAEQFRRDLAVEWLGQPMPNWAQPCLLTVQAAPHLGAGGATTFVFDRGEVFDWRMTIQGSRERILDSVLPHEITHTIFACRFRRPLPRWADEGGATTVEHASERNKYRQMLYQFLTTGHGIAFKEMFAMTDYPADIMPLYAQGYSLAEFLIQVRGRREYIAFLSDGLKDNDWAGAIERHYGLKDLGVLQNTWLAWVEQGSPTLKRFDAQPPAAAGEMLAGDARRPRPEPNLIHYVRNDRGDKPAAGLVPVQMSRAASSGSPAVASNIPAKVPASPPQTLPVSGCAHRRRVGLDEHSLAFGTAEPILRRRKSRAPSRLKSRRNGYCDRDGKSTE